MTFVKNLSLSQERHQFDKYIHRRLNCESVLVFSCTSTCTALSGFLLFTTSLVLSMRLFSEQNFPESAECSFSTWCISSTTDATFVDVFDTWSTWWCSDFDGNCCILGSLYVWIVVSSRAFEWSFGIFFSLCRLIQIVSA